MELFTKDKKKKINEEELFFCFVFGIVSCEEQVKVL